jgi:hypothetical protein
MLTNHFGGCVHLASEDHHTWLFSKSLSIAAPIFAFLCLNGISISELNGKTSEGIESHSLESYHGLPRSEMRQLFQLWLTEKVSGGES